ncbi:MAG: hypothetical protein WCT39_03865 [Candidatus Margulisiibacteriota bacterium]
MTNVKCQIKVYIRNFIFKIIIPSFVIFNLSFVISSAQAEDAPNPIWTTYGVEIANATGNAIQQSPQVLANGIIVWEDGRAGYLDIYAQKLDESGSPLWQKDGIPICRVPWNQTSPQVITDEAGGAFIAWQDYREGNADIYVQHINALGEVQWEENGLRICSAEAGQFAPELVLDGTGGIIISWYDYRSGVGEDIYAQRVDSSGTRLWENNGVPISIAPGTQWYPKMVSDGQQGAILVWADGRTGSSDNNIYAQRINSNGQALWEKDGITLCGALKNQERPVITAAPEGAIVAWNDARAGNLDIYAQKINFAGTTLWQKDGVPITFLSYDQENPRLAPDGSGGALVAWEDEREENSNIYMQRILGSGQIDWAENGAPVSQSTEKQTNPIVAKLAGEEWAIAWEEVSGQKGTKLFLQKINSAGISGWTSEKIPLASQRGNQEAPSLCCDTKGNILVAWQDKRSGNTDLYAQKISSDGIASFGNDGKLVCSATGSVIQQNVRATLVNSDLVLAYEDARSGYLNIYAQKINKSGSLLWGRGGIPVGKVAAEQSDPCIVPDGSKGIYVAWKDQRQNGKSAIRLQHLDAKGERSFDPSLAIAPFPSHQTAPLAISDKAGGIILLWQDDRNVLGLQDIYGQRISKKGDLLWGKGGKPIVSANGDQVEASMIGDGNGGAFIVWTDYRRGERNPDIYAQRIDAQGEPLWTSDGALVCGAPDIQRSPRLVSDGENGILVSWTDKGGGSYDIYAQRIGKNGQPLWISDGIPINQFSRTQQEARFGNRKVMVWEDYRFGNWDIFAGSVAPEGKLSWPEEGVPVVTAPLTQYAPEIIPWKDGGVIIAWEDYRCGNYYELYLQKLSSKGEIEWTHNGFKNRSLDGGRNPKLIAAPGDNSFYLLWEDYTYGDKAIYGQKYVVD